MQNPNNVVNYAAVAGAPLAPYLFRLELCQNIDNRYFD